ncbi:MAG: hypothetical protein ACK5DD_01420 [Cyclobacteriaceae bacterium]|jgi:hypothetical protein
MDQKIEMRKMRDFSAKINATFEFLRQNFKALFKSMLFLAGPLLLLQGIFFNFYQKAATDITALGNENFLEFYAQLMIWIGLLLVFSILSYSVTLIVVNEYIRLYESRSFPSKIEPSDIWPRVKSLTLPLIGVSIAVAIILMVALVFLIVPFFYLAVVLSLLGPLLVIEGKGFGEAFSRCFSLITEKWWSTFGLIFVTSLISVFMAMMFSIPQSILNIMLMVHKTNGESAPLWQEVAFLLSNIIYSLGGSLLQSIPIIAIAFQYYNLVERKEAAGLMAKLDTFGQAPQAGSAQNANETY